WAKPHVNNCVVIFSKTTCSYCNMAKKLFHDANINYTAIELDRKENGSQFQDVLHQMTGGRTVSTSFSNVLSGSVGKKCGALQILNYSSGELRPLAAVCM
uniref:Glutaredoxin domain-containing protein n=1 Tax=Anolis carolinensis TaxID=28377 RepID=H9GDN5_ANOCA